MDTDILITAVIGIFTTFFSGFSTWLFSKKKYNAEVDSNVIRNLQDSVKLYETVIKDLQGKLDFYVNMAEENRIETYRLKNIVFQILNSACVDNTCAKRKLYSEEEIRDILGVDKEKL